MCKIEVSVFTAICYVHKNIQQVNPFYGNIKFIYPLKTLLIFSGGLEMKHWCEIGQPNILTVSTLTYLLPAFFCFQSPLVALIVPLSNIPKVMQFVPQHCRKVTTTVLILSSIQKYSRNPATRNVWSIMANPHDGGLPNWFHFLVLTFDRLSSVAGELGTTSTYQAHPSQGQSYFVDKLPSMLFSSLGIE